MPDSLAFDVGHAQDKLLVRARREMFRDQARAWFRGHLDTFVRKYPDQYCVVNATILQYTIAPTKERANQILEKENSDAWVTIPIPHK